MGNKKEHPIVDFVETELVQVTVDGKPLWVSEGKPIAAALLQAGIDVFRFTEKRKAPRSLFCGIGQCNDCVMVVDGIPNVRTCVTRVQAGMVIETQMGLGKLGDINETM